MKIKEIYNLAILKGMKSDPRGEEDVKKILERVNEEYKEMDAEKKEEFDKDKLFNPYADTRILYGDHEKEVKKVMVGIDINGEELLVAKYLGDIDLVISHHPRGVALAGLDDVMELQIDMLHKYGIPVNIAEKLLEKRIKEVARSLSPGNHQRIVDIARILDIPLMCIHTPCDNLVAEFVDKKIKKDNPRLVKELIKSLKEIYEYKEASKIGAGPKIFAGSGNSRTGRILLTEITGGTEGSSEIYEKISQIGGGTVVGMHMSDKNREAAEKAHVNAVIAGHISSDSIGVNLFLDDIEKKGVNITPCSGLIRHSR